MANQKFSTPLSVSAPTNPKMEIKTEESNLKTYQLIGKLRDIARAISGQSSALDGLAGQDFCSDIPVSIPPMYLSGVAHLLEGLSSELDKTAEALAKTSVNHRSAVQ